MRLRNLFASAFAFGLAVCLCPGFARAVPLFEEVSPGTKSWANSIEDALGFTVIQFSAPGDVTGVVQLVGNSGNFFRFFEGGEHYGCAGSDFAGFQSGHIALMKRGGSCGFFTKITNAAAAGAIAALIVQESLLDDRAENVTAGAPVPILAFFTSFSLGADLKTGSEIFELTVRMATDATPLPGTLPLFLTGLGALGLFGWRRRRGVAFLGEVS
jgi:hypothetical protein